MLYNRRAATYTVRKMDLILRRIQRMLQTQLSMDRRITLIRLRRYSVKLSEVCNLRISLKT